MAQRAREKRRVREKALRTYILFRSGRRLSVCMRGIRVVGAAGGRVWPEVGKMENAKTRLRRG